MENWKTITGHPDYEVSDLGRVRSWKPVNQYSDRRKTPIIRSHGVDGSGYHYISLHEAGLESIYKVHRLVALMFLENPDVLPEVNHEDEDKSNNSISNLRWVTRSGNQIHSFGKKVYLISPSGEELEFDAVRDASRKTGLQNSGISRLVNGLYKQYKGWTVNGEKIRK